MASNKKSVVKLDEEFKANLKFIRPYVINLTDPKCITSCRVWLEKMSMCGKSERSVRNDYLSELCRQIKNGNLEMPFIESPPDGPLVNLQSLTESNSWSDVSTFSTTTLELNASGDSDINTNILSSNETDGKCTKKSQGDERKIHELTEIITEYKRRNHFLIKSLEQAKLDMSQRNAKSESGINMLASEVEYLKARLKELITIKRTLQASHNAIVLQWESTARNMETKLQEALSKNSELKSTIATLENKIKDFKNASKISTEANEKQQEELKNKEEEFAKKLKDKEAELEEKINEMKISYEKKFTEMTEKTEENLKIKDNEIVRLEGLVQEQCNRMQEQVGIIRSQMEHDPMDNEDALVMEKVSFLQKCIIKMEKLLRKYEKHYSKKVGSLKRELQMKESALEIQLTTQRAQLLAHCSTQRQIEIEEIVSQLEERYRQLLEDQQAQALLSRHVDQETIKHLQELLRTNNIHY